MATDLGGVDINCVAGESLTAAKYLPVYMHTDRTVKLQATAGARVLGVLQNAPASGGDARVRISGTTLVEVGAAIEEDIELTPTATSGLGKAASATEFVYAILLEGSAASGDHVRARLVTYQKNA